MSATSSKYLFPGRCSSLTTLNRILHGKAYQDAHFFLFVDENTYEHCLPLVISKVSAFESAEFMEVPVGEEAKTLEVAGQLWGALLESGADRNAVIVNIGGGCVSDLGGFVAAGYKRGIRYINIPTSLISMVDAGIGGKTALNLEGSKNQVGFFQMPEVVCIEPALLDTLPDGEMLSGLFEVFKTLAIADPEGYHKLLTALEGGNIGIEDALIRSCVEIKDAIVRKDPKDHGTRHLLNLGHTFGHAIEAFSMEQGKPRCHGESVALGMICAMYLSVEKLGFDKLEYERWRKAVSKVLEMPRFTLRDTESLLTFMRQDKKNVGGTIQCVLLKELGAAAIDVAVDENEIREALLKCNEPQ